jgi:predicted nucleic acid-binding protein
MKILVDADVLLEFFINRHGFVEDVELLLKNYEYQHFELYITDKCLKRIRLEDGYTDTFTGKDLACKLESILNGYIIRIDKSIKEQARKFSLPDFDSAEELVCAKNMNIDAIVTQNPLNFQGANFPIWSVSELLLRVGLEESLLRNIDYHYLENNLCNSLNDFDIKEALVFVEAYHAPKTLLNNTDISLIEIYKTNTQVPIEQFLDIIWWYADRD